ncbi:hypothetical protein GJV26_17015 [Massilia dura]|uniref:Uncharacterized protein n=1 Tax=Pseudoduganella dura TaxID=321982 RepID=A0A6I3XQT8_9BURK|nr:hypothetical protein [Pseudoduganella dura]MUI14145.1 hypothetical protein [Pseudoduganella dura]GGX76805.1 hypothetical protein GCM10007386_04980 [Pseudoduganella dura]
MNTDLYAQLIEGDLREFFIEENTFAEYVCYNLGNELDAVLSPIGEDEDYLPVASLLGMLLEGWVLDIEWLMADDGKYYGDFGLEIPAGVPRSISSVEHMAAYGVYLVTENLHERGPMPKRGLNNFGWSREQVLMHEAECLVKASQALGYAHFLANRSAPQVETVQSAMSALGRKGADAAHVENRALKKNVFEWCDKNMMQYNSMDDAALAIAGKLVPVKFRTVRSWMSLWKKQSAGTL